MRFGIGDITAVEDFIGRMDYSLFYKTSKFEEYEIDVTDHDTTRINRVDTTGEELVTDIFQE